MKLRYFFVIQFNYFNISNYKSNQNNTTYVSTNLQSNKSAEVCFHSMLYQTYRLSLPEEEVL